MVFPGKFYEKVAEFRSASPTFAVKITKERFFFKRPAWFRCICGFPCLRVRAAASRVNISSAWISSGRRGSSEVWIKLSLREKMSCP